MTNSRDRYSTIEEQSPQGPDETTAFTSPAATQSDDGSTVSITMKKSTLAILLTSSVFLVGAFSWTSLLPLTTAAGGKKSIVHSAAMGSGSGSGTDFFFVVVFKQINIKSNQITIFPDH